MEDAMVLLMKVIYGVYAKMPLDMAPNIFERSISRASFC